MTVRKLRVGLFLFCLITIFLSTGAAGELERTRPKTIGEAFRNTIPDSREITRDIMPWNWDRYEIALGIGAVTLPLAFVKNDIQEAIGLEDDCGPTPMNDFSFVENNEFPTRYEFLGNNRTIPAFSGAFVLGGLLLRSPREVETGLMLFESLVFTAAVTGLGQLILAEERPHQGGELRYFRTHGHGVSGHSSVSASMVFPLDRQYLQITKGDGAAAVTAKYIGKGILYSAPVMVGISRVRSNRHYLWNVVLGLATGYAVGKVVADVHDRPIGTEKVKKGSWKTHLEAAGVSLSFEW